MREEMAGVLRAGHGGRPPHGFVREAEGRRVSVAIRVVQTGPLGAGNGQQKGPGGCPPGPHVYHCVLLQSGFPECYGANLMVTTTVTCPAAGADPSWPRPSTGTMAVRTSPTLRMVTIDVPSENRGTVFDLRTMLRLRRFTCSTVWGVEASRM